MLKAIVHRHGSLVGAPSATVQGSEGSSTEQEAAIILPKEHAALVVALLEGLRPHLAAAVQEGLRPLLFAQEQCLSMIKKVQAKESRASGQGADDSRSPSPTQRAKFRKKSTRSDPGVTQQSSVKTNISPERPWTRWKNMIHSSEASAELAKGPCGVRSLGDARDSELLEGIQAACSSPKRRPSPHRVRTCPDVSGLGDVQRQQRQSVSLKHAHGAGKLGGLQRSPTTSESKLFSLDAATPCVPRQVRLSAEEGEPKERDSASLDAACRRSPRHPSSRKRTASPRRERPEPAEPKQAPSEVECSAGWALQHYAMPGNVPRPPSEYPAEPLPPPWPPSPGAQGGDGTDVAGPVWLPERCRRSSGCDTMGTLAEEVLSSQSNGHGRYSSGSRSRPASAGGMDSEAGQAVDGDGMSPPTVNMSHVNESLMELLQQRGRTFMRDGVHSSAIAHRQRPPQKRTWGPDTTFKHSPVGSRSKSVPGTNFYLQNPAPQSLTPRAADERWHQQNFMLPSTVQEINSTLGGRMPTPESAVQSHSSSAVWQNHPLHRATSGSSYPYLRKAGAGADKKCSTATSGSMMLRIEREEELLHEFTPNHSALDEAGWSGTSFSLSDVSDCDLVPEGKLRQVSSPLLLRVCSILPCFACGTVHRCCMLVLAAGSVGVFIRGFVHAQSSFHAPAECPAGVCIHFQCFSDMVLALGSFLGLLAMGKLDSMRLLGRRTDLLVNYSILHEAVSKWSSASFYQAVYLAILWVSSMVFRCMTIWPDPSWSNKVHVAAFTFASFLFMGLVFGILHVSCLISILIDSYVMSVKETQDFQWNVMEWDKLSALLRKVSRAVHHGFLLVQSTAVAMLLCSFSDLVLGGGEVWWFISNILLAQSLALIFFKAAEVTEMCTRVPSLINSMQFEGNDFTLERHYLVEHITYSTAGFYIGEVRLTANMAAKLVYVSILAAFGVLTKLTTA